jgi:SAM-dependent methyltransferase
MNTHQFDAEGLFGDDYLYFFASHLEERSDAETDLIWRLLGLQPDMEVLDLACGHGRIANRLAGRGCRVAGLDSTELFLDRARRDAAERGVTVEYVRGDMRELPWRDRFDAIVNWFTAFGYFDDPGNQRVLAQAAAALRPGGRIALEMNNYLRLLRDTCLRWWSSGTATWSSTSTTWTRWPAAACPPGPTCAAAGHGGSSTRCACSASPSCGTGCGRRASQRSPATARTGSR